jgi:hypothetical protein
VGGCSRGHLALAAGMLALMAAPPAAQAEERVCRGTIGAKTAWTT